MIVEIGHWKYYARKIDKVKQHDRSLQKQYEKNQKQISKLLKRQEAIMEIHEHNKMLINYSEKKKKEAKENGNIRS